MLNINDSLSEYNVSFDKTLTLYAPGDTLGIAGAKNSLEALIRQGDIRFR